MPNTETAPELAAQLQASLHAMSFVEGRGTDTMQITLLLAGLAVETMLLFDEPDQAMEVFMIRLSEESGRTPYDGPLGEDYLPPSKVLDFETERGRMLARVFFEDWLECGNEREFVDLLMHLAIQSFAHWDQEGLRYEDSLRLLFESMTRAMAYEISAQELCDLVIEKMIATSEWQIAETVSGLSAMAGRKLAISLCGTAIAADFNNDEPLDSLAAVMTREAVRYGVPAGSDWRFGLAANDGASPGPVELVDALEPHCTSFFSAISLTDPNDQAVACAKAAGRMLAVIAGGDLPEMEPIIAKPLAMAAMVESCKALRMLHATGLHETRPVL